MRKIALCLATLAITLSPAMLMSQQQSRVVFYIPNGGKALAKESFTLGMVPGEAYTFAYLHDGESKIGNMGPGHFISLSLPSGKHILGASGHPKHPGTRPEERVELDLEPGKTYFVKVSAFHKGFYIAQSYTYHVTQTTCSVARESSDAATPNKAKYVEKAYRDALTDSAYFPKCQDLGD